MSKILALKELFRTFGSIFRREVDELQDGSDDPFVRDLIISKQAALQEIDAILQEASDVAHSNSSSDSGSSSPDSSTSARKAAGDIFRALSKVNPKYAAYRPGSSSQQMEEPGPRAGPSKANQDSASDGEIKKYLNRVKKVQQGPGQRRNVSDVVYGSDSEANENATPSGTAKAGKGRAKNAKKKPPTPGSNLKKRMADLFGSDSDDVKEEDRRVSMAASPLPPPPPTPKPKQKKKRGRKPLSERNEGDNVVQNVRDGNKGKKQESNESKKRDSKRKNKQDKENVNVKGKKNKHKNKKRSTREKIVIVITESEDEITTTIQVNNSKAA